MPKAVECFTVSLTESSRGILGEITHGKSREDMIGECQMRLDQMIALISTLKDAQNAARQHQMADSLAGIESGLTDAAMLLCVIPMGSDK